MVLVVAEGKGNVPRFNQLAVVQAVAVRKWSLEPAPSFLRSIDPPKSLSLTAPREQQRVGLGTLLTACTPGSLSSVCLHLHSTRRIHLVPVLC